MTGTELVQASAYSGWSLPDRRAYIGMLVEGGDLLPRALMAPPQRNPNGGGMLPAQASPGKVLLLAETGDMLGMHPVAALQTIHIIEGKPSISAAGMSALVRRAGHKLRVHTTGSWTAGDFVATAELIRSDDPDFTFVVKWDIDRARRAGLISKKGPWSIYPEAMAKARAISEVIREGATDALMGIPAYVPEELGAKNVDKDGDVIDGEIVDERPQAPSVTQPTIEQPAVVDNRPAPTGINWVDELKKVTSVESARDLYRFAQSKGALDTVIPMGQDDARKLSEVITVLAEQMKDHAEAASAAPEQPQEASQREEEAYEEQEPLEGELEPQDGAEPPMAFG